MSEDNTDLKNALKTLIVETLNLDDMTPEEIPDDEALFDTGLDSIDALELVLRLEKDYGIKIKNSEESRQALASVNILAAYVQEHRIR